VTPIDINSNNLESKDEYHEVPPNTIPLFGDCFTNEDTDEEVKVVDGKSFIKKKAHKYVEYLNLEETDPIFCSSFSMMIKQAFRNDKHFIIAKI
jgi:hypothetical protein